MTERKRTLPGWGKLKSGEPGTPVLTGQRRRHPAGAVVTITAIAEVAGHALVSFRATGSLIGQASGTYVQTWAIIR